MPPPPLTQRKKKPMLTAPLLPLEQPRQLDLCKHSFNTLLWRNMVAEGNVQPPSEITKPGAYPSHTTMLRSSTLMTAASGTHSTFSSDLGLDSIPTSFDLAHPSYTTMLRSSISGLGYSFDLKSLQNMALAPSLPHCPKILYHMEFGPIRLNRH